MLLTQLLIAIHLLRNCVTSSHPSGIETPIFRRGLLNVARSHHDHRLMKRRLESEVLEEVAGGTLRDLPSTGAIKGSEGSGNPTVSQVTQEVQAGEKDKVTTDNKPLESQSVDTVTRKENNANASQAEEHKQSTQDVSDKPKGDQGAKDETKKHEHDPAELGDSHQQIKEAENSRARGTHPPSSPVKPTNPTTPKENDSHQKKIGAENSGDGGVEPPSSPGKPSKPIPKEINSESGKPYNPEAESKPFSNLKVKMNHVWEKMKFFWSQFTARAKIHWDKFVKLFRRDKAVKVASDPSAI